MEFGCNRHFGFRFTSTSLSDITLSKLKPTGKKDSKYLVFLEIFRNSEPFYHEIYDHYDHYDH